MSENMGALKKEVMSLRKETGELRGVVDQVRLQIQQQQQIIDQYRVAIYNNELKDTLLNKMLEEKGIMAKGEFDKRWPTYLKNEVGVMGQDGIMEGSLKVTFYGKEKQ